MAVLVMLEGLDPGRKFVLERDCTILGRQFDAGVCLNEKAISRQHAQILRRQDQFFVEDLASSNGTFLNGKRIKPHEPVALQDGDTLQIGSNILNLRKGTAASTTEPRLVVREEVPARAVGLDSESAHKLNVVLEIAQNLARTLDLAPLLDKLLEQLMRLFPETDRGLVISSEEDELIVRAERTRSGLDYGRGFSRTVVRRALDEGRGFLSDDVQSDPLFSGAATLTSLNVHSVLIVPLINQEGRRLGVLQMDRFRTGLGFRREDLQLLTTVGLQVTIALENATLHAQRLQEQRVFQELALARRIQQGFLPAELEGFPDCGFEIFGRVYPANEVAGDFYDYLAIPDGRLGFFIGDVSGKGMPAALFMVAVRTLCRHLAKEATSPGQLLSKLNLDLADDNPGGMFATLLHGWYDPRTGETILASAGHPRPLIRHVDGFVREMEMDVGRLVGFPGDDLVWREKRFTLREGDLLAFYTDGFSEARETGRKTMFGKTGLQEILADWEPDLPLSECADRILAAVEEFSGLKDFRDDATLLLLRRQAPG